MSVSSGYIKLHRKILDWEWYDDPNVIRLFIHSLMRANHKAKMYRGILIEPGQFTTSQESLASELGVSIRQIRTALGKLKATGELTVKITNKYSMISITNWDSYQVDDRPDVTQKSLGCHSDDRPMTTNKNVKNVKNVKNKDKKEKLNFESWPSVPGDQLLKDWLAKKKKSGGSCSQTAMNTVGKQLHIAVSHGFTVEECLEEAESRGWKGFKAEWMKNNEESKQYTGYAGESKQERVANKLDEIAAKDIAKNGFTHTLDN